MSQLFDTHAHLNLSEFADDYKEIARKSLNAGISIINVGVNYASSERAVEIANGFESGIWAAVGLHPENIGSNLASNTKKFQKPENIREPEFNPGIYRGLVDSSKKVVAIGEIGLDYLRLPKDESKASLIRLKQQDIFKKQLALASELGLPAIIHTRKAHQDTIRVLCDFAGPGGVINGVVHCFTGNANEARQYYDLGLYFGLNGIIFKMNLNEAITQIPLERILLETDCPYLSPHSEIKRNEPVYVENVAQCVAQIRRDSVDTIIKAATVNAQKLFRIG